MADETKKGDTPATPGSGAPAASSGQAGADDALQAALNAISELGSLAGSATQTGAAPASGTNEVDVDAMAAAMLGGAAASATAPSSGPAVIGATTRAAPASATTPISFPNFELLSNPTAARAMDLLGDVHLNVKIELGRTRMYVDDVLKLGEGSVIELDKLAGDPVDVYVNDRHVARGEVLVLNDNFCIRVNEILTESDEATRAA